MMDDIVKHLEGTPFQPFIVRTADGQEYPVPTIDHIYLPPGAKRVIIADDEGITVNVSTAYLTALVHKPSVAESETRA